MPLTHYLNRPDAKLLKTGDQLYYQPVNHPANSPKRIVTFVKFNNTGIGIKELQGSIFSGNLWVDIDETSGEILIPAPYPENPNLSH